MLQSRVYVPLFVSYILFGENSNQFVIINIFFLFLQPAARAPVRIGLDGPFLQPAARALGWGALLGLNPYRNKPSAPVGYSLRCL